MAGAIVVSRLFVLAAAGIAAMACAPKTLPMRLGTPPEAQEREGWTSRLTLSPRQKAVVGMWRLGPGQQRAMFGAWLAIRPANSSNEVEVVWDNGVNCSSARGTLEEDRLRVRIWDVPTQIVVKSGSTAVVRFDMKGWARVIVHLKKTSESPFFACE